MAERHPGWTFFFFLSLSVTVVVVFCRVLGLGRSCFHCYFFYCLADYLYYYYPDTTSLDHVNFEDIRRTQAGTQRKEVTSRLSVSVRREQVCGITLFPRDQPIVMEIFMNFRKSQSSKKSTFATSQRNQRCTPLSQEKWLASPRGQLVMPSGTPTADVGGRETAAVAYPSMMGVAWPQRKRISRGPHRPLDFAWFPSLEGYCRQRVIRTLECWNAGVKVVYSWRELLLVPYLNSGGSTIGLLHLRARVSSCSPTGE